MAGVETLEQANRYLETEFIPWWNETLAVEPKEPQDAHRPLGKDHHLEAILSHVETRKIKADYTFQFEGRQYVIERSDIRTGLRGASIRIEKRRDGAIAVRFEESYLHYRLCDENRKVEPAQRVPSRKANNTKRPAPKSSWMEGFLKKKGPTIGKAIALSNATS